jgi:hypothetical protein
MLQSYIKNIIMLDHIAYSLKKLYISLENM